LDGIDNDEEEKSLGNGCLIIELVDDGACKDATTEFID
jgi:hypothetical protein